MRCWFLNVLGSAAGLLAFVPAALAQTPQPASSQVVAADAEHVAAPLEVVIHGTRPTLLSSPRSPTAASTVLVGDRVRRTGDSTGDVLRQVPGVQVTRTGSDNDAATLSIRGAAAHQVPVYLAGIRLNDEVTGSADLSLVPLWMVDRIEVFRGNAPVASDRLGMAGAVYFEPRRGGEGQLGAGAAFGSHGSTGGWAGAQFGAAAGAPARALVALRASRADNDYAYQDDHGRRFDRDETTVRRPNADVLLRDAWAVGELRALGLRFVGVSHALDKERGVTGIATTPAQSARQRQRRLLTGLSVFAPCAADGACEVQLSSSLLADRTTLEDPLRELRTLRSVYGHVRAERFNQSARWVWQPEERWQLGMSASHTSDLLALTRLTSLPRKARRTTLGASVDANMRPLPRLGLHALLGAQCANTDGHFERLGRLANARQQDCDVDDPDARVGASFDLAQRWALLGNVARTARLPTLGELYGTGATVEGNDELRPEQSTSADLGLRGTAPLGPVTASVDSFVFARWSDNLVRYRRTSQNAIAPYNVGSARVLGVELAAASRWYDHVTMHTALTVLEPVETTRDGVADPTLNDVLPLTSRLVFSQGLQLESDWERWNVRRVSVGARYFYRSNRFADPAGLVVLPEQHQWDVHGRVHLRRPNLDFTVAVDDVFDTSAIDVIGLPLPGRTFHAALEAWW